MLDPAAAAAAAAKSLQSCPTLWDPIDGKPTRFLCPWDFPGKSTGVGCHCLLQGLPYIGLAKKFLHFLSKNKRHIFT